MTALPQLTAAGGALAITGTGATNLTIRRDPAAAANFGVLNSLSPNLTLTGFTINGGRSAADGGGILMSNTVTLDGMVFSDNRALAGEGGAIYVNAGGFLAVRNSTISGNSATTDGGGIYFFSGGGLVVDSSTISGNTTGNALGGGGIYFFGIASASPPSGFTANTLVIRNSTIANNTSGAAGGGIVLPTFTGTLLIQNSTITGNTAATSGGAIGLPSGAGSITMQNSTIAGNTANGAAAGTGGGGIGRVNHGGVGDNRQFNRVGEHQHQRPDLPQQRRPERLSRARRQRHRVPRVGPAVITWRLVPTRNSVRWQQRWANANNTARRRESLVGAGGNALVPLGMTNDQRGSCLFRTFNNTIDIGAVEVQPPGIPFGVATAANVTTTGATSYTFTVTYYDATGLNNGLDVASIIGNNAAIHVVGPGGFDAPATFVSIDNPTNGWPRTATYTITPPGGAWDPFDRGTYSVNVVANQVADLDGNVVAAGSTGICTFFTPNYMVFTAADSGFGRLRQVIEDANLNPAADTITFDPSFFNTQRTIALLSVLPQFNPASGDLTITGPSQPGDGQLRRRAATTFRIFDSLAPNLTMSE